MGRHGFGSLLNAMARDVARQQRMAAAEQNRRIREAEKAKREAVRQAVLNSREEKQRYLQSRIDEVEELNEELKERQEDLTDILMKGVQARIIFPEDLN